MREPDYKSWEPYEEQTVPEEGRVVLLRYGDATSMYMTMTVMDAATGYGMSSFGNCFWSDWRRSATHWVYLDELKRERVAEEKA